MIATVGYTALGSLIGSFCGSALFHWRLARKQQRAFKAADEMVSRMRVGEGDK